MSDNEPNDNDKMPDDPSPDDPSPDGELPDGEQDVHVIQAEAPGQTIIAPGQMGPQEIPLPDSLPILAVRDTVIFPGTVMSLQVGRDRSKRVIDEAAPGDKMIGIVSQTDPAIETPGPDQLLGVGTVCMILRVFKLPDGNQSIVLHGLVRFRTKNVLTVDPVIRASVEVLQDQDEPGKRLDAMVHTVRETAREVIEKSPNVPEEALVALENIDTPGQLADFLAANLVTEFPDRQDLLEQPEVMARLRRVQEVMADQVEMLDLSAKIQQEVKGTVEKQQREYFLREQLKAIKKELGEDEPSEELSELKERLEAAGLPEKVQAEADREMGRLSAIPQASPEYNVIRTYLEWLADLPWSKSTEDNLDIKRAGKILDEDHYDLTKVKQRILEYLAVRKLRPEGKGPILCFLGPPGVGKTSLGQSIARALGRQFVRMSLGGIRDEADIRGHRRTYIGSMPGRIIQEIRKAGANNPLMMLDEIDKIGQDFRGDPASALLEVLDPAQNDTFTDHYLDVAFDLSNVMFIGTANTIDPVPPALRDRMEIITLAGYTDREKKLIAERYLVPRQLDQNGLTKTQCRFKEDALKKIIREYTREAGVRNLERSIAAVCRAAAARIVRGDYKTVTINADRVEEYLGPTKVHHDAIEGTAVPGVATGLAYTPVGGEIIFVEAAAMPGQGRLTLTGQIGDVMRESANAAFSIIRSRCDTLGIDGEALGKTDIHIHVPAGAVPKDGPSAGVAMLTALASLLLDKPVKAKLGMTGEITLRGQVLPIGGLKEKALAAKQAGITDILLPQRNMADVEEIRSDDPELVKGLKFHPVGRIEQVLNLALKLGLEEQDPPSSGVTGKAGGRPRRRKRKRKKKERT